MNENRKLYFKALHMLEEKKIKKKAQRQKARKLSEREKSFFLLRQKHKVMYGSLQCLWI